MRSFQDPDFASRFNVMLYREPICVLVLCTDQTPKALQIQQVVAATGEIVCTGEMNRLFDDVFRGFDLAPLGTNRLFDRASGWPNIEVSETDKEVRITAELPGLDENDVDVELANGVLAIRGEKTTETQDKDRLFSERHYGRFERRVPVEDVDEDNASATFKNGVLTVKMPKTLQAQSRVKHIAINRK